MGGNRGDLSHVEVIKAQHNPLECCGSKRKAIQKLCVLKGNTKFFVIFFVIFCDHHRVSSSSVVESIQLQPRSQGLSSLPPLVVGRKTLVAAGHVPSCDTNLPIGVGSTLGTIFFDLN